MEQVYDFNYLGSVLVDRLTLDKHIDYIHSKSVNMLGIIRRARNFLDRGTSILLYKSLALLHLDYCDLVYSDTSEADLNKLQLLQNGACRTLLLADKRSPVQEMHNKLRFLTLSQRRDLHLAVDR